MTANDLKNRIDELCAIVSFVYEGKEGHVDPYSHSQYLLWFDGDEMMVNSIDRVMNTPFFDGRTLNEIADKVTAIDY